MVLRRRVAAKESAGVEIAKRPATLVKIARRKLVLSDDWVDYQRRRTLLNSLAHPTNNFSGAKKLQQEFKEIEDFYDRLAFLRKHVHL